MIKPQKWVTEASLPSLKPIIITLFFIFLLLQLPLIFNGFKDPKSPGHESHGQDSFLCNNYLTEWPQNNYLKNLSPRALNSSFWG